MFPRAEDKRVDKVRVMQNTVQRFKKRRRKLKFEGDEFRRRLKHGKKGGRLSNDEIKKRLRENRGARAGLSSEIDKLLTDCEVLETEILKRPVDAWTQGKGNPVNRMMVYRYYTSKFRERVKKTPPRPGTTVVVDCAVSRGKYKSMWLTISPNFVFNCKFEPPSMLCEGEQNIMGYLYFLDHHWKRRDFVVHSIDTDTYTYVGLYYAIMRYNKRKDAPRIRIKVKNWGYRLPENRLPRKTVQNSNRMYLADVRAMCVAIEQEYGKAQMCPIATFFVFWGIFFGCDFIVDVHKTVGTPEGAKTATFLDW